MRSQVIAVALLQTCLAIIGKDQLKNDHLAGYTGAQEARTVGANAFLHLRSHQRSRAIQTSGPGLVLSLHQARHQESRSAMVRHQQQRLKVSKRWRGADSAIPQGTLSRNQQALVEHGIAAELMGISQNLKRGVNAFITSSAVEPTLMNSVAIDEVSFNRQDLLSLTGQDGSDSSYFCSIRLGSSGKLFKLVIDTGSSDVWVPGEACDSTACSTHASFGPSDSTTYRTSRAPWQVSYGSGTVSGIVVEDYMQLGDLAIPNPVAFGTAHVLATAFKNFPSDGILGLGQSTASSQKVPTLMDNLVSQGLIERKVFAVNLQRAKRATPHAVMDGQLSFGIVDTSKFYGRMITTPNVSTGGLWEAKIDGVYVGGEAIPIGVATGIIDTGTTLLLAPPVVATAIHLAIPGSTTDGSGSFLIPCSTITTISFAFGGTQFFIDPRDYVGGPSETGEDKCISNITGQQILGPLQFLIGDVFLKNVYTAFDIDNQEIGFGAKSFMQSA